MAWRGNGDEWHHRKAHWRQTAIHAGAWLLLAWIFWQGRVSANPVREWTLRTGRWALNLLMLSLACTPIQIVTGWKGIVQARKPLGLYAFAFAMLHLLIYAGLDFGLDMGLLWGEVLARRFIWVGLAAFVLLFLLAVTSTRGWVRRLGRQWKLLHRLAYGAALLAVWHFLWVVKATPREPLVYGVILTLLLIVRLPPIRSGIERARVRWFGGKA